jgi:murein DD-endopeptidase MepM/ murein hydrolase activator NlpD
VATLTSKGQKNRIFWSLKSVVRTVGEEVVSWKRRVESFVTSQCTFVKLNLSVLALVGITFGGLTLAQAQSPQANRPTSFEVFRSIRTAEAMVSSNDAVSQTDSPVLVASALDDADDYIREIFGSPIPNRMTAAEAAVKRPLAAPLPESVLDNGPAPLPEAIASLPSYIANSRGLLWPMRGGLVTSRFGMRWGRMHQGTDIAAPYGTPILAAADGKVIFSGWEGGYGQLVIVDHGNGLKTKYGHCSQLLVHLGEAVRQGDLLGKVGTTGHATGPHLHYEVIREGMASNPETFTRRR